jgi:hypothetical protein
MNGYCSHFLSACWISVKFDTAGISPTRMVEVGRNEARYSREYRYERLWVVMDGAYPFPARKCFSGVQYLKPHPG